MCFDSLRYNKIQSKRLCGSCTLSKEFGLYSTYASPAAAASAATSAAAASAAVESSDADDDIRLEQIRSCCFD